MGINMSKSQIAVLETKNPLDVEKVLKKIDAYKYFKKNEKILIKPNYVTDDLPSTGVTTDPYIIIGVINYLYNHGFENIVVGEGGIESYNTMKTFQKVGLTQLIQEYDIELIDLNKDEMVSISIPNANRLKNINVAKSFVECDAIFSVSKLKVHSLATTTLNMKNMMGGILPKNIMHKNIHEKIVDLNRAFMPRIGVIDGIIGCQCHETEGNPINSNVIIAGADIVATDTVGSFLMGVPIEKNIYLTIASQNGMGISNIDEIEIIGSDIHSLQKKYIH